MMLAQRALLLGLLIGCNAAVAAAVSDDFASVMVDEDNNLVFVAPAGGSHIKFGEADLLEFDTTTGNMNSPQMVTILERLDAQDVKMEAQDVTLKAQASKLEGQDAKLAAQDIKLAAVGAENVGLKDRVKALETANAGLLVDVADALAAAAAKAKEAEEEQAAGVPLIIPMVDPRQSMPPCNSSTPRSLIYTHTEDLAMDVMQTCASIDEKAAWRPVVVMGGLISDSTSPSAFASAVNSGLPGVYVFRAEGGAESEVLVSLRVHANQDVRILSPAKVLLTTTTTTTIAGCDGPDPDACSTFSTDKCDTIVFNTDVTASCPNLCGSCPTPAKGGGGTITFAAVDVDEHGLLSFGDDLAAVTFNGGLTLGEGVDVEISNVENVTFASTRVNVELKEAATLKVTNVERMKFDGSVTLDAGSELKLDGDMEVTSTIYDGINYDWPGIWACVQPSVNLGKCILANGVMVKVNDVHIKNSNHGDFVNLEGTLPGKWTATKPISGNAVGVVSWAEGSTKAATWAPQEWLRSYAEVWDSYTSPQAEGKGTVTNKNGKRFALYLMPFPQLFSYDEAGYEKYSSLCASAGLKMIISGWSSYSNKCSSSKCIPMPGNDRHGYHWGSTSDVDDNIHRRAGWTNFVITNYDGSKRPYNYPGDTGGWSTPKRAVCGIEL